jgi:hypothetical protein
MNGPRAHRRAVLLAVVPALLVAAPSASALTPPAEPPATTPAPAPDPSAPAPAPAPAPTVAKLSVVTEGARSGKVLRGDRWTALAVLGAWVPGTTVKISFTVNGRKKLTRAVPLKQSKDGKKGVARFVVPKQARNGKRVAVRAEIAAGQPVAATRAKVRLVVQASPSAQPGDRGPSVRILQGMLKSKGYVIGAPGLYDARTQRAVLAFRKVTRMARTTQANRAVFSALRAGKGRFRVRFPSHGRHVEGDISRQVLALIGAGGKVERIYHTSSGAPATPTIRGSYRVYMKDPGTNAKGMYKSSYFIRGYAVHGYPSVPVYNASHGCFRVPMADAASIFAWMTMGTIVDTY